MRTLVFIIAATFSSLLRISAQGGTQLFFTDSDRLTQPDNVLPATPSLGADPEQDSTALDIISQIQDFAQKLLAREAQFLAQQNTDDVDFDMWYSTVLSQFKLKQDRYPYRNDQDKQRDLNNFEQALSALKDKYTNHSNEEENTVDKSNVRGLWNMYMSKLSKALSAIADGGDQYNDMKEEQAGYFNDCSDIAGSTRDGNSRELVDLSATLQYKPDQWDLDNDVGPLGSFSTDYPIPECKLGILYSQLQQLTRDYFQGTKAYKRQVRSQFVNYQQQWLSCLQDWYESRKNFDLMAQRLDSVNGRMHDLVNVFANIMQPDFVPESLWTMFGNMIAPGTYDNVV